MRAVALQARSEIIKKPPVNKRSAAVKEDR